MKRSRINRIIADGGDFIRSHGYLLPPFADWSPAEMKARRGDIDAILTAGLGWDVTDYAKGDFEKTGLFLFTVRNGDAAHFAEGRGMLYAEKIMISRRDQLSPMHRHVIKAEDIINRGGGTLCLRLFASAADGSIDHESPLAVPTDGLLRRLQAGETLGLSPGESVTLLPGIWHEFRAEGADVLIGEVSTVNDDVTDNVFAEPTSRFSNVEEDAEPLRLLVSDYPTFLG